MDPEKVFFFFFCPFGPLHHWPFRNPFVSRDEGAMCMALGITSTTLWAWLDFLSSHTESHSLCFKDYKSNQVHKVLIFFRSSGNFLVCIHGDGRRGDHKVNGSGAGAGQGDSPFKRYKWLTTNISSVKNVENYSLQLQTCAYRHHRGEKPLLLAPTCVNCRSSFITTFQFKRHKMMHTNKKRF